MAETICYTCNKYVDKTTHECPPRKEAPVELKAPWIAMKAVPTRNNGTQSGPT